MQVGGCDRGLLGVFGGTDGPAASCASQDACDMCAHVCVLYPVLLPPPAFHGPPQLWQRWLWDKPLFPGVHQGQYMARVAGLQWPPAPQAGLRPGHPKPKSGAGAPGGDPLIGLSGLSPGKSEGNGKMHITLCDLVSTWDSLSPTQKKSLNQRYQMGCECKVSSRAAPEHGLRPTPHTNGVCSPEAGTGSAVRCFSLSFKDDTVQGAQHAARDMGRMAEPLALSGWEPTSPGTHTPSVPLHQCYVPVPCRERVAWHPWSRAGGVDEAGLWRITSHSCPMLLPPTPRSDPRVSDGLCYVQISRCLSIPCFVSSSDECLWTDWAMEKNNVDGRQAKHYACIKRSDGSCAWYRGMAPPKQEFLDIEDP